VDHFKRINDTHGHLAGDAVLKQLAERLHGVMRAYDAFGRYGGEEFLLVLPGLSLAAEEGMRRVEAIQRSIAQQPFDLGNGQEMTVTCSAGAVGALAGETSALEALIDRADAALYNAKRDGRNRVAMAEKS
jgi:diguanylate cyclase (GGDEF)-like protein